MNDFVHPCRAVLLTAAIYQRYLRAKAPCHPCCVHGDITPAGDHHATAPFHRGIMIGELVRMHEIHPCQEFIG